MVFFLVTLGPIRNLNTMRLAFITYIRPILEYNSIVWNPNFIHLIYLIENVQRNFSKRIPSLSSLPYAERLALFELRRLRFDLIYYYKVFNHLTPFNPNDVFIVYSPDARSRSNLPYLQKPIKAIYQMAFISSFFRSIDAWNALPLALRCSSLSVFKRSLKQFDLSAYLKGSAV